MTPERLQVILRDETVETLNALTASGRTRTDVIHRAIDVLRYVEDVQREGGRMLVRSKAGDVHEVVWP